MGKSILKDLRSREHGRKPLKLHGLPRSFHIKHDSNNGDVLSHLASVARLLRKRGKLESNADLAAFSTPIEALVETLGVHGSRPEEPSAKARASFVRLGGPTLVAAILQARGLAPVADTEAQIAANAVASTRAAVAGKDAASTGAAAGGASASDSGGGASAGASAVRAADLVALQESADEAAKIAVASAVGVAERTPAAALEPPPPPTMELGSRALAPTPSGPRAQRTTETNLEMGNMILALLTEVVLGSDEAACALASWPSLIARLFALMTTPRLLDGAVSLAQELLSSGSDMFNLADVPNLSGIVARLPPRAFSLFSRTLAALLSKPEPPFNALAQPGLSPSLPPPECLAPNLCAACANRSVLVDIPGLLAKLVLLLRSKCPPKRLWPAMHYYLPSGNVIAADLGDDDWLSFAKRGQVPILDHDGDRRSLAAAAARSSINNDDFRGAAADNDSPSPHQEQQFSRLLRRSPLAEAVSFTRAAAAAGVRRRALGNGGPRPGLPVSLSATGDGNGGANGGGGAAGNNGNGGGLFGGLGAIVRDLRAGFGGDRLIVLPAEQLPPGLEGDLFPHHPEGDLRVVKLAAFEDELWKTLEADLLFVVGTLLSNKAREKAQALLVKAGFVELLDELFERLDWRPPVKPPSNAARSSSSRDNTTNNNGNNGGGNGGDGDGGGGGRNTTNTAAAAAAAPNIPLSEALQSDSDIDSDDELFPASSSSSSSSGGNSGARANARTTSGSATRTRGEGEGSSSGGGYTTVNPPLALEDLLRPGHLEAMLNEDRRVYNTGGPGDVGPNELDSARAQIAAVATQLALHSMSIGEGGGSIEGVDRFPPRSGAASSRSRRRNNDRDDSDDSDDNDDDGSYIGPRPAPSSSTTSGGGEGAFSTARAWAARFMGRSSEATVNANSSNSASGNGSGGSSSGTPARNASGVLSSERIGPNYVDEEEEDDDDDDEDELDDLSESEGSLNGTDGGAEGEGDNGDDDDDEQDPSMHGEGCSCCAAACLEMSLLRTVAAFSEKTSGDATHHRLLLSPLERRATAAETGPVPPSFYSSLQTAEEGQLVVHDGWIVAPSRSRSIEKTKQKSPGFGDGDDDSSSSSSDNDDNDDDDKYDVYGSDDGSDQDSEESLGRPLCSCCNDLDIGDTSFCQPCEHYNPSTSSKADGEDGAGENGEGGAEGRKDERHRRKLAIAAEKRDAKTKAKAAKNKAAAERRAYQAYTSQALDAAGSRMEVGLVRRVADLLVTQSSSSPYYFECASTLHKWLQGARPSEQDLLLRGTPGLLHWTLRELLNTAPPPPPKSEDAGESNDKGQGEEGADEELFEEWCSSSNRSARQSYNQSSDQKKKKKRKPLVPMDDSQRVLCDLLGELLKFNGSALKVLDHALGCPSIIHQVDQYLPPRAQTSVASFRSIISAAATAATTTNAQSSSKNRKKTPKRSGPSSTNHELPKSPTPPAVTHRSKRDKHDDCPLSPPLLPSTGGGEVPPLLSESIIGAAAASDAEAIGRGSSDLFAKAKAAPQAPPPASPWDVQMEASRKRFEALGRVVLAQPVNSAVLIQCLELTLGAAHKPLRLRARVQQSPTEASAAAVEVQAANHRAAAACDPDGYLSSNDGPASAAAAGFDEEDESSRANELRPGEKWVAPQEVLSLVAASVPPKRWRAKALKTAEARTAAAAAVAAGKKAKAGEGAVGGGGGGTRHFGSGISGSSSNGNGGSSSGGGGGGIATSLSRAAADAAAVVAPPPPAPNDTEGASASTAAAMPPGRGSNGRGVGGGPKVLAPVQLEALQLAAVRAAAAAGCGDTSNASASTSGGSASMDAISSSEGGGIVAFWSVLRPYVAVALFRALSAIPAANAASSAGAPSVDEKKVHEKGNTSTTATVAREGGGNGNGNGGAAADPADRPAALSTPGADEAAAVAASSTGKAAASSKPTPPFSPDLCVVNATCVMLAEALHAHEKGRVEEDGSQKTLLLDSWNSNSDLARILTALEEDANARLAMKTMPQASNQTTTTQTASSPPAASTTETPPPPVATLAATATSGSTAASPLPFRTGLRRALHHWCAYYEHQTYERKFVEFQTGMPFPAWRGAVKAIEGRVIEHLPVW